MTYRRHTHKVTADTVIDVRKVLNETQDEFARRFSRSRFAIIRWECDGVKFKYKSQRWLAWQAAVGEAFDLTKGTDDEPTKNMRALRVFLT